MIFEANADNLLTKTIPLLVLQNLRPEETGYEVSVNWADRPGAVLFSTRGDRSSVASGADITAGMFSSDIAGLADRRLRRSGQPGAPPRWILAVRHREGSLDAVVSRTRVRNFVTSLILIFAVAGAVWALVR